MSTPAQKASRMTPAQFNGMAIFALLVIGTVCMVIQFIIILSIYL